MSNTESKLQAALPVHPGSPLESDHPLLVVEGLVAHRLELAPADHWSKRDALCCRRIWTPR